MQNLQNVNLKTLSEGAMIERGNLELEKVLENIEDPNTGFGIREINIKLKFKPREDRQSAEISIQATSKLAPVTEHLTQVYLGQNDDGDYEMAEVQQATPSLFPEDGNITSFNQEGTNN